MELIAAAPFLLISGILVAQRLVADRHGGAPGKAHDQLPGRHGLQAVSATARRFKVLAVAELNRPTAPSRPAAISSRSVIARICATGVPSATPRLRAAGLRPC